MKATGEYIKEKMLEGKVNIKKLKLKLNKNINYFLIYIFSLLIVS